MQGENHTEATDVGRIARAALRRGSLSLAASAR